jgi:hypothetical protein
MKYPLLAAAAAAASLLAATPVLAQSAQGAPGAAETVDGMTGDTLNRFRGYVTEQRRPSVRMQEQVVVGSTLPGTIEYYEVPASSGVTTRYRYAIINDRTVLVDPQTRRVVQVIQ